MAIGSIIYLIKVKKQPFFFPSTRRRGWLRCRPLHSYHLLVVCFMFFEAIHLMALIYESYPTIAAAEVGNIAKNVIGNASAIFYAVSIVCSTPSVTLNENYELSIENKGPNARLVDIIGIILSLLPMITGFLIAFLTGHFAEIDNIQMANLFFRLNYLFEIVWQISYLTTLAYLYYKLMIVIKYYVKILEGRRGTSEITDENQLKKAKKCTKNVS
ncbi:hypothetical protein C1645_821859 [Glomus cerebriforme]|uniref:Uncharacterized protein n=1 Tax=Glomus cerebriforme TaxID=658196 RepID=A0A397SZY1_9GLOM|nr:hypothetical protein C1645_821859 [Glomus cerebriforme]